MSSVACPDCQYEISELALDCPQCGQPQPDLAPAGSPEKTGSCGYCGEAVTALGLATAALIIWPLAIAAVVYGFSALGAFREPEGAESTGGEGTVDGRHGCCRRLGGGTPRRLRHRLRVRRCRTGMFCRQLLDEHPLGISSSASHPHSWEPEW